MSYEPWMLAAIDQAGYNGIRNEHISAVAAELLHTGLTKIDRSTFEAACRRCGVAPDNPRQCNQYRLAGILRLRQFNKYRRCRGQSYISY